jgi:hypothetical protein
MHAEKENPWFIHCVSFELQYTRSVFMAQALKVTYSECHALNICAVAGLIIRIL